MLLRCLFLRRCGALSSEPGGRGAGAAGRQRRARAGSGSAVLRSGAEAKHEGAAAGVVRAWGVKTAEGRMHRGQHFRTVFSENLVSYRRMLPLSLPTPPRFRALRSSEMSCAVTMMSPPLFPSSGKPRAHDPTTMHTPSGRSPQRTCLTAGLALPCAEESEGETSHVSSVGGWVPGCTGWVGCG